MQRAVEVRNAHQAVGVQGIYFTLARAPVVLLRRVAFYLCVTPQVFLGYYTFEFHSSASAI